MFHRTKPLYTPAACASPTLDEHETRLAPLKSATVSAVDDIRNRIQEHVDAGASHVCLQPVNPNGQFGDLHWACLEELAG